MEGEGFLQAEQPVSLPVECFGRASFGIIY